MSIPRLIGMIHLDPLPGSPGYRGSLDAVTERAVSDAVTLREAGFPALMIENFGDVPFFPDDVPPVTLTAMTRIAAEVASAARLPIGINVLRNDGLGALAVAAATGASMIRVNVLSGMMYTDQGPIVGRAAEIARFRATVTPSTLILADVFVKHATPVAGAAIELVALDTWERAGADALVVSGTGTGAAIDLDDARRIRDAVPDAALIAGSGATAANLAEMASVIDGAIVGTSIKVDDKPTSPVSPAKASDLITAARSADWI